MTEDEKSAAAKSLLEYPIFTDLLDEMEANALDQVINALRVKDTAPHGPAADVRAIRDLRARVESLATQGQSSARNKAPA